MVFHSIQLCIAQKELQPKSAVKASSSPSLQLFKQQNPFPNGQGDVALGGWGYRRREGEKSQIPHTALLPVEKLPLAQVARADSEYIQRVSISLPNIH